MSESKTDQRGVEKLAVRRAYEPPRAEFVPLQIEERLMACNKFWFDVECNTNFPPASFS